MKEPTTLGEHLKRSRLSRKLTQRQAAAILDVDPNTIFNWEKDKTDPPVTLMPRILQFLGYDPCPEPKTLSERMLAKRREMGWTVREASGHLGVAPSTWGEWERTGVVRWKRYRALLQRFIV